MHKVVIGVPTSTAYSDISDDDSVLDMVAEIDNIKDNTEFESSNNESVIDEWIISDDKDSTTQDEINTIESDESTKCEGQDHNDEDFTTNNVIDIEESRVKTKYEVYTVTMTKELRYLDNELVDTYVSYEQDYYEFNK